MSWKRSFRKRPARARCKWRPRQPTGGFSVSWTLISIAFLAGRSLAVPLENPRQVSAYHYPAEYVGHRTIHVGDAAGQARETLINIETLLDVAGNASRTGPYTLAELKYRAYVRHAADCAEVARAVEERVVKGADVVYVQADICRADLLVEIEALTFHGTGTPTSLVTADA